MEVKNNLEEQLSKFRNTASTGRLPKEKEMKSFTFKRLSFGEIPINKPQIVCENRKSLGNIRTCNTNCQPSKPMATVAPVTSVPPRSFSSEVNVTPKVSQAISSLGSPIILDDSPPLKTQTTPTDEAVANEGAEYSLLEIQEKRLKVMDDICEILNEVPASVMSTLFGASAGFLQKKLAMRRKLLSQEAAALKMSVKRSPALSQLRQPLSPAEPPATTMSCDSHVTDKIFDQAFEEWEEIEDDEPVIVNQPVISPTINNSVCVSPLPTRPSFSTGPSTNMSFTGPSTNSFSTGPSNNTSFTGPSANSFSKGPCTDSYSFEPSMPSTNSHSTDSFCTGPSITRTPINSFSTRPSTNYPTGPSTDSGPSNNSFSTGPPEPPPSSALTKDNSVEFASSNYPHSSTLVNIFRSVFGLNHFRPKQLETINAAILGRDCFILMPTGGGKSLCYQLPALAVPGVTVVVSPLRSLIHDQVQKLCSLEIPACHLSGEMNQSEELTVYTELSRREPGMKLLYVTPEKLVASQKLMSTLQSLFSRNKLARFVIDEAHCISSWGHDFRPDYKRLSQLRSKFPLVPLMALTATATPRVQADILNQLKMKNTKWFTLSFNRTNLIYSVVPKKPKKVTQDIIDLIHSKFRNQSGIIYCLSRRDCEVVSGELNQCGIPSVAYHAGLQDDERCSIQNRWLRDANCKVVCATIAFGMGIDKPDVRFVIHHTIAKSIEGYYQESGRAGRDGRPAHCILYYNYGDMSRIRRLLMMEDNKSNLRQNMSNLCRMVQYCENESDCRRLQLLEYFSELFNAHVCKSSHTPCDNCQSSVPHSTQYFTELVQTIVQSINILSFNHQFTLVQHLEALRGGNSVKPHLLSLPYSRKGLALSKHDLERLLHMMVLKNILAEDLLVGTHGNVISYVKTGSNATDVLNGSYGTILLKVKSKGSSTGSGNIVGPSSEEDRLKEECYQDLKILRARIAMETSKNPEVIIAITTLQDMSQKLPTNKTEMLGVQGMTEAKWKNSNGEEFLEVTSEYAAKRNTFVQQQQKQHQQHETVSPFFSNSEKENIGQWKSRRKRVKSAEPKGLKKDSSMDRLNVSTVVTRDSDDEFESSILKKKKIVSKQTRLPGFLSVPRK